MAQIEKKGARGGLVVVGRLFVLAVVAACAGCTDEACFSWTKAEGACPAQEDALQFFVPPGCFGPVQSVDSEGEFVEMPDDPIPGDLCCYEVTESEEDYPFCGGSGF
jgi:hypothetical protein